MSIKPGFTFYIKQKKNLLKAVKICQKYGKYQCNFLKSPQNFNYNFLINNRNSKLTIESLILNNTHFSYLEKCNE